MRRARLLIIVIMVASIAVAAITRDAALNMQSNLSALVEPGWTAGGATIASMNSFALALLLGGLRGPLVMVLWASSESQKADRDLEDFDTKVEWIRLLQPEFDTVHMFQIWNKAYNISAQMVSLNNKYISILDALDYARSVDRTRPDDINILNTVGQVYSQKLGNSQEKRYYQERLRQETVPHPPRQKAQWGQPGFRRLEMDVLLDEQFNLLPGVTRGRQPRPGNLQARITLPASLLNDLTQAAEQVGVQLTPGSISADVKTHTATAVVSEAEAGRIQKVLYDPHVRFVYSDWNTGADLQYLGKYQPYPFGLPPLALGYNYYKRAQVLQSVAHQKALQISASSIDRGPAIALKQWAEGELLRGQIVEMNAYGIKETDKGASNILSTESFGLDRALSDKSRLPVLLYTYELCSRLCLDAISEFQRHISNPQFLSLGQSYQSHVKDLTAHFYLTRADHDYLVTAHGAPAERDWRAASAKSNYQKAQDTFEAIVLEYYVDDDTARQMYPAGYTRVNISQLPAPERAALYDAVIQTLNENATPYEDTTERMEYEQYVHRVRTRLQALGVVPAAASRPATASAAR